MLALAVNDRPKNAAATGSEKPMVLAGESWSLSGIQFAATMLSNIFLHKAFLTGAIGIGRSTFLLSRAGSITGYAGSTVGVVDTNSFHLVAFRVRGPAWVLDESR